MEPQEETEEDQICPKCHQPIKFESYGIGICGCGKIDYADGYDERMNPYDGTCPKHGHWKGSIDECPKCMNESAMMDQPDFPNSICWGCENSEEEPAEKVHCGHYGFPMKPIKKKCKWFHDNLQNWEGPDPLDFDPETHDVYEGGAEI